MYKTSVIYEVLKKEGAIFAQISCSECDSDYDKKILYNSDLKAYTDQIRTKKYPCNKIDIRDLREEVSSIIQIAQQYVTDRRNAEYFSRELYQTEGKEYAF